VKLLQSTRVAAAVLATALLATACGGSGDDDVTPDSTDDAGADEVVAETLSIGVSQIVTHPSLDAAREGFKAALADAGYDVNYDEQNAQGDQSIVAAVAALSRTRALTASREGRGFRWRGEGMPAPRTQGPLASR